MNRKVILTTITILWMIFIFLFSSQEATESSKLSDSFIDKTVINVYKVFDSDLTKSKEHSIKEILVTPIRKLAHLSIYLILGILVYLTLTEYKVKKIIIYALIICLAYAISDEFHQLFVKGRSGEVRDVIIDTLGSSIGIILINRKRK